MTGIEGEISRHPLIGASKLVELNLSETSLDDRLSVCITKSFPMLGILNVSRCYKLTNVGVEQASFPSLRFLALVNCVISIDAILYILEKHGVFALCVKEIKLKSGDLAHLVELYTDIAERLVFPLHVAYRKELFLSKHFHNFAFTVVHRLVQRYCILKRR